MPPKKKGKKAKKGPPMLIDGVDTSAMTRDQLEAFALRLKAEMEREREERNFFQLERDKIRTFWEISRDQLEETRTELRQKDREVAMAQDMSDMESKLITQQMKHMQYENQTKIGEVRAEAMTQLQLAQENHHMQEQELLRDKRKLKKALRARDELFQLQLQELKMKHSELTSQQRIRFEQEIKRRELIFQETLKAKKDKLTLIWRMQIFEFQERKNWHIFKLIENHNVAFQDMKSYYNEITLNNLGLINSLKEQMEALRKQAEKSERTASETISANKNIREPLERAEAELADLRRQLEHANRDRSQLKRLQTINAAMQKELQATTWEMEALTLRNDALVKERDDVQNKFDAIILELQHKTGLRSTILERKLAMLEHENEKRDVIVKETLEACGCSAEIPLTIDKNVRTVIDEKNKIITDLKYELVRLTKAHDDMIVTFEAKLRDFGIPKQQLGFKLLRNTTEWKYLQGPAGLIAKNN